MDLLILSLLSFLLGGSGNDLLDYVPTDVYWKAKQTEVTVATMSAELRPATDADVAGWLAELDAPDPQSRELVYRKLLHAGPVVLPRLKQIAEEADGPEESKRARLLISRIDAAPKRDAVRRLMAIRALGDLKRAEGAAALKPLLGSKEVFVAEYAAGAIAQIDGKAYARPLVSSGSDVNDLEAAPAAEDHWLLPADCRAVLHVAMRRGQPIDYAHLFAEVPLPPNQNRAAATDFIASWALNLAEQIGNVRLEAITAGVSADANDRTGYVAFILAGRYDPAALASYFHREKVAFDTVAGAEVFFPDADTQAFLPSATRLVVLSANRPQDAPTAGMIAAMKSGAGQLKTSPDMTKLIGAVDTKLPVWAVVRVSDDYRKHPLLSAFDTLTLTGRRDGAGMKLAATGDGSDATKVKATADTAIASLQSTTKQVRRVQTVMPALRPMAAFLSTIQITAADTRATATANVAESPSDSFLLPLIMTFGIPQDRDPALPKE